MQDLKMDGIVNMAGGEYGNVSVDGIGKCQHSIQAQTMDVKGIFTCKGGLRIENTLRLEGKSEVYEEIRAKTLRVKGYLSVKQGAGVYANEILCEGMIDADGEISADLISVDGYVCARELVGDCIEICLPHRKRIWWNSKKKIDFIEATTIKLSGVCAKEVSGTDVEIGPGCRI